jgi:hypothetical protein
MEAGVDAGAGAGDCVVLEPPFATDRWLPMLILLKPCNELRPARVCDAGKKEFQALVVSARRALARTSGETDEGEAFKTGLDLAAATTLAMLEWTDRGATPDRRPANDPRKVDRPRME